MHASTPLGGRARWALLPSAILWEVEGAGWHAPASAHWVLAMGRGSQQPGVQWGTGPPIQLVYGFCPCRHQMCEPASTRPRACRHEHVGGVKRGIKVRLMACLLPARRAAPRIAVLADEMVVRRARHAVLLYSLPVLPLPARLAIPAPAVRSAYVPCRARWLARHAC